MVEDRRRELRARVRAKARLQSSGAVGEVLDISGRGLSLMFAKGTVASIPAFETILVTLAGSKRPPCRVEAELKWNYRGSLHTIAGFEIRSFESRSLRSDSCRAILSAIAEDGSRARIAGAASPPRPA